MPVNPFLTFTQGYLVLNKLSGCLNFWIFLFSPGAVPNRTYRAWGVKIGLKSRKLNRPDVYHASVRNGDAGNPSLFMKLGSAL